MRKLNKWFILTVLLTISLSILSILAYRKTRQVCTITEECAQPQVQPIEKGEMLIDAFSKQFTSFIAIP